MSESNLRYEKENHATNRPQ